MPNGAPKQPSNSSGHSLASGFQTTCSSHTEGCSVPSMPHPDQASSRSTLSSIISCEACCRAFMSLPSWNRLRHCAEMASSFCTRRWYPGVLHLGMGMWPLPSLGRGFGSALWALAARITNIRLSPRIISTSTSGPLLSSNFCTLRQSSL